MLGYLAVMLILPISALLAKSSLVPLEQFIARATEPVALSAYYVSFSMAIVAGVINAVFGFLLAWVLVKYEFPGEHPELCNVCHAITVCDILRQHCVVQAGGTAQQHC